LFDKRHNLIEPAAGLEVCVLLVEDND